MTPTAQYVLVYEFSPYLIAGWPAILIGIVFPAAFWLASFPNSTPRQRVVLTIGTVAILAIFAFMTVRSINRHYETTDRLKSGDIRLIEGTITDVHCIGKARQAFTVAGESFAPDDVAFQPGFVSAGIFSNSVTGGMRVRVHFFDASWGGRVIIKLENDTSTGLSPPGMKLFGPCGA